MSGVGSETGLGVTATGTEDSGTSFVYTGHVEHNLARLSLAQKQPFGVFEIPAYPRPGYGKLGKEVDLLVNHFRLNMPDKLRVHHYYVKMQQIPQRQQSRGRGRGRGRGGHSPQPQELKLKKYSKMAFWAAIRRMKDLQQIREIDQAVFDDDKNAWFSVPYKNLKCIVPHPDEKCQKAWEVEVFLQFNCSYAININAANPTSKQMSELFLKCLLTQRVRYAPKINAEEQYIQFAKSWEFAAGSMFKVHRELYGCEEDEKRRVFPGIRAWIGLNASPKPGEDGSTYVNLGLSNRLYYFPEMDLITFIREVIMEEKNQYIAENDNFKRDLKSVSMNDKQRCRMSSILEGLRVKTSAGKGALIIDFGKPHRDPRREKPPKVFLGERHYKIVKLVNLSAKTYQPELPRNLNRGHTMEEIYHNFKTPTINTKLDFPNLPLVEVQQGGSTGLQPLEVLLVHDTPQRYAKHLEMKQQRRYIQKATKPPPDYKEETDDLIRRLHIMGPGVPFLQQYAVSLDPNWTSCTGKVLDLPVIRDVEGKPAEVLKNYKYKALELTNSVKEIWIDVVITHCPRSGDAVLEKEEGEKEEKAEWFYRNLIKCMRKRGLSIINRDPQVYYAQAYSNQEKYRHPTLDVDPDSAAVVVEDVPTFAAVIEDSKKRFVRGGNTESRRHVMLFFTSRGSDIYGRIKSLGNNKLGVATQIVDVETYYAANSDAQQQKLAIFYNLALKINAKLGGVNMKVDLPQLLGKESEEAEIPTVMYIGIDVTHPGTETLSSAAPIDISIAAIVGSTDYWGTTYRGKIYAQMVAKETVECFDRQFVELIWAFQKANNAFPKHVVIYRDGVSNSEMINTASLELGWIKGSWEHVCSISSSGNRPPPPTYTYIVVQKRHRTRFVVPMKDEKNPYVNPSPGTVVDRKVVSPQMYDFYLASQYGSIGTSRIAHYTVVYDEWQLAPDDVYAMTYRLAFLNARCRNPCALPAPVFYAHQACCQAREMYRSLSKYDVLPQLPHLGENPTIKQKTEFDLLQIERKHMIEKNLNVAENYPGMHFV